MGDRALLICRQSLTRRDSVSLEMQDAKGRDYITRRGYRLIREPIWEESVKGWREGRDPVEEAKALAAAGELDVVVAWDMSRVARSVRLLENLVHDLQRCGARFESVTEEWVSQPFVRQVMAAKDEEQTRTISRNTRAAFAARVERGLHHGRPPIGYRKENRQLVIVPEEAAVVCDVHRWWRDGVSIMAIVDRLIRDQIPPRTAPAWCDRTIRKMLTNPVYAGCVRLNGRLIPGQHEPILSSEDFAAAQTLFERRPRVLHRNRQSWCEGLVVHACGERMYLLPTSVKRRGERGPLWVYACRTAALAPALRCGQPRPRLVAWKVEAAACQALAADLGELVSLDDVIAEATARAGGDDAARERRTIAKRRTAVLDRLRRAETLYLDGKRDRTWFDGEEAAAAAEARTIDVDERAIPAPPDVEGLRLAASRLDGLADVIPDVAGDALRLIVEEVGTIVVGGCGVGIAYRDGYRGFVRCPVTVAVE